MRKVLVSWSSGKDSAWLIQMLRGMPDVQIGALLTTNQRTGSARPMFTHPIAITTGGVVERDGFVFCDMEMGHGPVTHFANGCEPGTT
jgi:hypothetical protein